VGVIYAVLVAFVVVTAWQTNDHAKDLTMQEQHEVDDMFHLYAAFHNSDGDPKRDNSRPSMRRAFGSSRASQRTGKNAGAVIKNERYRARCGSRFS
jgi:hypothetical protein